MITDIPDQADFEQSGIALLNLAWDSVLSLYLNLELAEIDEESGEEVNAKYWKSAQVTLSTALALVQQGTEFLSKGRIAAVSPFLLLSGDPRDWPRNCERNDLPFADFRSIDAQDLIRAHDTVTSARLSEVFKNRFEHLRRLRNTTMHTVDRRTQVNAKEVIKEVLEVCEYLIMPLSWVRLRRSHLEKEPRSQIYVIAEDVDYALAREMMTVIELLEPSLAIKYFDFNKRQRRYYCLPCLIACQEYSFEPNLAQLRPAGPSSNNLWCLLCGQNQTVNRRQCRYSDCRGNVIESEEDVCLTCSRSQT